MEHLQQFKNTTDFTIGQQVYYTGDRANLPSWGKIVDIMPGQPGGTPLIYCIQFEDSKANIPHFLFTPGIGQQFKTIEQVKIEREIANNKLHNFLRSCNNKAVALLIGIVALFSSCSKEYSQECGIVTYAGPDSIRVNQKVFKIKNAYIIPPGIIKFHYHVGDKFCY